MEHHIVNFFGLFHGRIRLTATEKLASPPLCLGGHPMTLLTYAQSGSSTQNLLTLAAMLQRGTNHKW